MPEGNESSAAVAEAAEALRDPGTQEVIADAVNDPDPGGGEVENDPAPEPDKEQSLDDDEPGEDEFPEGEGDEADTGEGTPGEAPGQGFTSTEVNEEQQAILARYPDDASRAAAFERLESLESGESPISQDPAGEEPEASFVPQGTTPQVEELETILKELQAHDPQLDRTISELGHVSATLKEDRAAIVERQGDVQAATQKLADAAAISKYTKASLDQIPEEDSFAREAKQDEIARSQQAHTEARGDLTDARNALRDIKDENRDRRETYNEGVQYVRSVGTQEWTQRVTQSKNKAEDTATTKEARSEWDEIVPRVMESLGVDKGLQADFEQDLCQMVDDASDRDLSSAHLESWMRIAGKGVLARHNRIREATVRKHVENRRDDTIQPAPANPRVTRPKQEDKPMSSKEADRLAQISMRAKPGSAA